MISDLRSVALIAIAFSFFSYTKAYAYAEAMTIHFDKKSGLLQLRGTPDTAALKKLKKTMEGTQINRIMLSAANGDAVEYEKLAVLLNQIDATVEINDACIFNCARVILEKVTKLKLLPSALFMIGTFGPTWPNYIDTSKSKPRFKQLDRYLTNISSARTNGLVHCHLIHREFLFLDRESLEYLRNEKMPSSWIPDHIDTAYKVSDLASLPREKVAFTSLKEIREFCSGNSAKATVKPKS